MCICERRIEKRRCSEELIGFFARRSPARCDLRKLAISCHILPTFWGSARDNELRGSRERKVTIFLQHFACIILYESLLTGLSLPKDIIGAYWKKPAASLFY
jgi:hypothetical protein